MAIFGQRVSRVELFEMAERLTDGGAIPADGLASINRKKKYRRELEAIRATLECVENAGELKPSEDSAKQLLDACRRQRRLEQQRQDRRQCISATAQGAAFATGLVVLAVCCFQWASNPETVRTGRVVPSASLERLSIAPSPEEDMQRVTREITSLAEAVRKRSSDPLTPQEREQRRIVRALEEELSAAVSALQRNPGNMRAQEVVQANMKRAAETLRDLYTGQSY